MSNYTKLKTNLKLAIQRLKLLEKKKTELSLKSRREIADYIQANKADRARIRVEHIIREDNYVEAMEMLEMFCDLLLARFGLIEKMKELDPGLDEAIGTLVWASPRISNDIQEFKLIGDAFSQKYGKKYADACKADTLNNVNEKVKKRLGLEPPSKLLVEQYLIEIAKNFNMPYEPDQSVMLRSGLYDEELINLKDKTNEYKNGGNNNNGGAGGGFTENFEPTSDFNEKRPIGFTPETNGYGDLIDLNNNLPNLPNSLPYGDLSTFRKGSSPPPSYNIKRNTSDFGYPDMGSFGAEKSAPSADEAFGEAPALPNKTNLNEYSRPPSYMPFNQFNSPPPAFESGKLKDLDDLDLPSVPGSEMNNESNNDDLDEITKRFHNLKNNK
ncbi:IST1 -like protein [Brachionus plicatilis]|uniref:IST1 homolog n=1 Tax=Brachionus plicatilis TaxID=10195 RepID=A0A3M7SMP8_BRAPC|nr:IST1 -like protein [Brachionus plicatilis]